MIKEATLKLKEEMDKSKKDTYVQVVGEFLMKYIELNPGLAEKIMNKEKTIKKSLDAMKEAARKKKVGNCAVLADQEGFEIVLKYYDINTKSAGNVTKQTDNVTETAKIITEKAPISTANIDFDVRLEDLI